ncbi:MAG: hypothetical protein KatS3mg042_0814 [Rhodothermaceae bacterium]|nr:MAG: hypothetical protein KatS3mg042_0814 [Rhodothermaceae bacterium]
MREKSIRRTGVVRTPIVCTTAGSMRMAPPLPSAASSS